MCKGRRKQARCMLCLRATKDRSHHPLCSNHKDMYLWDPGRGYIRRKLRKTGQKTKFSKIWPSQARLHHILEELGWVVHHEVCFPDLLSPKGACLRWDMVLPDLRLIVEYDGDQHQTQNRFFFRSRRKWEYYLRCQRMKEEWAKEAGWKVLRFTPEDLPFDVVKIKDALDAIEADTT